MSRKPGNESNGLLCERLLPPDTRAVLAVGPVPAPSVSRLGPGPPALRPLQPLRHQSRSFWVQHQQWTAARDRPSAAQPVSPTGRPVGLGKVVSQWSQGSSGHRTLALDPKPSALGRWEWALLGGRSGLMLSGS